MKKDHVLQPTNAEKPTDFDNTKGPLYGVSTFFDKKKIQTKIAIALLYRTFSNRNFQESKVPPKEVFKQCEMTFFRPKTPFLILNFLGKAQNFWKHQSFPLRVYSLS